MSTAVQATKRPTGRRGRSTDVHGREQLLDIATKLFSERGIANTTVAQIAAASGVTSAMVHYWFDSREQLLDSVAEERVIPFIGKIWGPANLAEDSALEIIEGLLGRMMDLTQAAPWLPALWLREIIQDGGLLRDRVIRRIPRQRNSDFRAKFAQAQADGEINPDVSPDVIFISMLGLVMLPQSNAKMWHQVNPQAKVDRAQLERHIRSLLLNGLVPSTGQRRRAKKQAA